jgi:hypothetical protein
MNVTKKQPTIAELTANMLNHTTDAATLETALDALGAVEPHEVAVGFRAEPRLAWQEALAVLAAFGHAAVSIPAPADWGRLVVRQEAVAAVPFALGNYPQRVRDLGTLLAAQDLRTLLPTNVETEAASNGLVQWGTPFIEHGTLPQALVAAANYRAANDFDRAATTLADLADRVPSAWQPVLANEQAALLWQRGQFAEALAAWERQADSAVVSFNRGMANLFLGNIAAAQANLRQAVALLPDNSAWHHLASLYAALAAMKAN